MVLKPEASCGTKHLLLLAGFTGILLGLAITLLSIQSAMAEKLEGRIRQNEQFRAEMAVRDEGTQAMLVEMKADLKDIKAAVKNTKAPAP